MLIRTVIWFRWVMALLALAVLAALVASKWYQLDATLPPTPSSVFVVSIDPGHVQVQWDRTWSCDAMFKLERTWIPWGVTQSWNWMRLTGGGVMARAPLGGVALPPTLLATAGFWARRRRLAQGLCKGCRHPLMGAQRCPECGREEQSN